MNSGINHLVVKEFVHSVSARRRPSARPRSRSTRAEIWRAPIRPRAGLSGLKRRKHPDRGAQNLMCIRPQVFGNSSSSTYDQTTRAESWHCVPWCFLLHPSSSRFPLKGCSFVQTSTLCPWLWPNSSETRPNVASRPMAKVPGLGSQLLVGLRLLHFRRTEFLGILEYIPGLSVQGLEVHKRLQDRIARVSPGWPRPKHTEPSCRMLFPFGPPEACGRVRNRVGGPEGGVC